MQLVARVRDDELVALFVTPSLLAAALGASDEKVFVAAFARVRVVWLTGESVRVDMVARFARAAPHCALRNVYSTNESGDLAVCDLLRGAEADDDVATRSVREDPGSARVPPFELLAGVRATVRDDAGRAVPRGAVGHLDVRTAALMEGYWTAGGGVAPRARAARDADEYRTGDLVRVLGAGRFAFVARATGSHVKIRGFKVFPGAIRAELARHPAVRAAWCAARGAHDADARLECAVLLRDTGSDKDASASALNADTLRRWLTQRLPHYMVPAVFLEVCASSPPVACA